LISGDAEGGPFRSDKIFLHFVRDVPCSPKTRASKIPEQDTKSLNELTDGVPQRSIERMRGFPNLLGLDPAVLIDRNPMVSICSKQMTL